MKVELIHHTPLYIASKAIRKCWASEGNSDSEFIETQLGLVGDKVSHCNIGPKDKELIHRVGNKNKHSSTLEHLNYSFDIDGISRACLQELARHRIGSPSVKSTRYTLKELRDMIDNNYAHFLVSVNKEIDVYNCKQLSYLRDLLKEGIANDKAKYMLPEAYKTSLVWTINARSLQNFLSLRTDKSALWEIRELAYEVYNQLPDEHKYLFEEFVKIYDAMEVKDL